MSDWLEIGAALPEFSLSDADGNLVHSADLLGKPLVLYFYPRDNTPGCTRQACAFRDSRPQWQALGANLIGISGDDQASHDRFRSKFDLNFPLLVDADHQLATTMGAWREKNMYGKKSMGIQRSTFLFDAQGRLVKLWKRVRVDGHDQQVLEALQGLAS